ncbi:MAG: hypothetical protein LBQ00_06940 [Syntrophobacterales bacterium]|jgi:hypothetical protein|nr:hypothetical protein [Syntrophobacterales bacterium]
MIEMTGKHNRLDVSRYTCMEMAIVHLADVFVKAMGFGFAGDRIIPVVNSNVRKLLGLTEGDLKETEDGMEAAANLFQ